MSRLIPPGDRTQKWNNRYDPEHIKTITTAEKPTYLAHATVKFNDLYEMEVSVKNVLNGAGVSVADVANYLAYSRQVWKMSKTHDGETLRIEVEGCIVRWVARGLTRSVMEVIRDTVFHITAPSSP